MITNNIDKIPGGISIEYMEIIDNSGLFKLEYRSNAIAWIRYYNLLDDVGNVTHIYLYIPTEYNYNNHNFPFWGNNKNGYIERLKGHEVFESLSPYLKEKFAFYIDLFAF